MTNNISSNRLINENPYLYSTHTLSGLVSLEKKPSKGKAEDKPIFCQ